MIKHVILTTVFIISTLNIALAADKYNIGDELYVWAKSGLNMLYDPSHFLLQNSIAPSFRAVNNGENKFGL